MDNVFLANSNEAIWQIEQPDNGYNTQDGAVFNLSLYGDPSSSYPYLLSDSLVYNFDPNDFRKMHWIDSVIVPPLTYYYPNKYKLGYTNDQALECTTPLRLSEQYLIRAEARAQQGELTGAISDLNIIRKRVGLQNSNAATQQDLIAAIFKKDNSNYLQNTGIVG